jgi:hypothetical protein
MIENAEVNKYYARRGKNHKECIVFFKEPGLYLVMIPVQIPKKPVHDIPVSEPGNSFHHDKCSYQNQ